MIQLKVNGATRRFNGSPEMPLLWYLRDELQLTGTKISCGEGICGTCTVHINGEPVQSCMTPMSRVAGKEVVTIEGLDAHGSEIARLADAGKIEDYVNPLFEEVTSAVRVNAAKLLEPIPGAMPIAWSEQK